jgi:hypothetical protein
MKFEKMPKGGYRFEVDDREALLLRYLAERASFVDTPVEVQEDVLRLADEILAALGYATQP